MTVLLVVLAIALIASVFALGREVRLRKTLEKLLTHRPFPMEGSCYQDATCQF